MSSFFQSNFTHQYKSFDQICIQWGDAGVTAKGIFAQTTPRIDVITDSANQVSVSISDEHIGQRIGWPSMMETKETFWNSYSYFNIHITQVVIFMDGKISLNAKLRYLSYKFICQNIFVQLSKIRLERRNKSLRLN